MKLKRISVRRLNSEFAVSVAGLSDGLNTVYGSNGTGKSTTWAFLQHCLEHNLPQHDRGYLSGSLELEHQREQATILVSDDQQNKRFHLGEYSGRDDQRIHFEQALHSIRPRLFRDLYFAKAGDVGSLSRLFVAVGQDGVSLKTKTLQTPVGKKTIRNQLCPYVSSDWLSDSRLQVERLNSEIENLKRQQQTERHQWTVRKNEREAGVQKSQLALQVSRRELTERQQELSELQAVENKLQAAACEQTSHQIREWIELTEHLELFHKRAEQLSQTTRGFAAEQNELQSLLDSQAATRETMQADSTLLSDIQQEVRRMLFTTDACPDCGEVHLESCDDRWKSLKETVHRYEEQQRDHARQHCGAHCQCDLHQELQEVETLLANLKTRQQRMEKNYQQAIQQLRTATDVGNCSTRLQENYCTCQQHEVAWKTFEEKATPYLEPQRVRNLMQHYRSISQQRSNRMRIAKLESELQGLLNRISHQEVELRQQQQRLADLDSSSNHSESDREIDRLVATRLELLTRIERHDQEAASLQTVPAVRNRIEEIRQAGMISPVLAEISLGLCEQSAGKWRAVRWTKAEEIECLSVNGVWTPLEKMGAATQNSLAMLARIAFAKAYLQKGWEFPLLFDDMLADLDDEQQQRILARLSKESSYHQIILFTCHQHLAEKSRGYDSHVITLGEPTKVATLQPVTQRASVPQSFVSASVPERMVTSKESGLPQQDAEVEISQQPLEFSCSPHVLITTLPQINQRRVRQLQSMGIATIDDLVRNQHKGNAVLLKAGIEPSRFKRWQATGRLMVCLPGISAEEARLLALANIDNAQTLLELDDWELTKRIENVRNSSRQSAQFSHRLSTRRADRNRWQRSARSARTYEQALQTEGFSSPTTSRKRAANRHRRTHRAHRSGQPHWNQRQRSGKQRTFSRTSSPFRQQNESAARQSVTARPSYLMETSPIKQETIHEQESSALTFYLSRNSPVVDAPSIGPKTAKRLKKAKIRTVQDLLEADPERAAAQVNAKHIPAKTIGEWQEQSRLQCCVPELRGHDVQILVACGIATAVDLSRQSPHQLLHLVTPFANSPAGERLLRSSKKPDLEEVTNWISWAENSRPLSAA